MAITPLPLYGGTPPNRTQPTAEFNTNIAAWVTYTTTIQPLYNTFAEELVDTADAAVVSINASIAGAAAQAVIAAGFANNASGSSSSASVSAAQALSYSNLALGAANFKGAWSSLTGALNVPASVYHNGLTYVLLTNLVDVTAAEPSAGAVWAVASGDSFRRHVDTIFAKALFDFNFKTNSYKVYELYGLEPKQLTSVVQTVRASAETYNTPLSLQTAAIDSPSIEYDRNTGEPLGINSRPVSTNLLLHSQYTAASGETGPTGWVVSQDTGTTTTAASSRFSTAIRLTASGSAQREVIGQTVTLAAATTYTFSCYFAQGTAADDNVMRVITADAPTGTLTLPGSAVTSAGVYSVTFTTSAGGSYTVYVGLGCSGNATGTVIHETPQLEAGSFYTGYIPTTTAQVARAAGQVRRDISSNFNLAGGVFYVEFVAQAFGNLERLIAIGDTTSTQECSINYGNAGTSNKIVATIRVGAANVNLTTSVNFTAGQQVKAALRYVRNADATYTWTFFFNGALGISTTTTGLPTGYDKLGIGCRRYNSATLQPYTPIGRAAYIGGIITSGELQAMTA